MADDFMRSLSRTSIAQICQTIGYNSSQSVSLEILQDVLHRFLVQLTQSLKKYAEHYNRSETNLDDVSLSFINLNINVAEILDYIANVEPVSFIQDVPKYPAKKVSNLNFLKPGSKEVLSRPIHIYEYLPPILSSEITDIRAVDDEFKAVLPDTELETSNEVTIPLLGNGICDQQVDNPPLKDILLIGRKSCTTTLQNEVTSCVTTKLLDEEGQPAREISSVVMTSGGYISPAIEGKLPDSIIPDLIDKYEGLDAPPPPLRECIVSENDRNVVNGKNNDIIIKKETDIIASDKLTHDLSSTQISNISEISAKPSETKKSTPDQPNLHSQDIMKNLIQQNNTKKSKILRKSNKKFLYKYSYGRPEHMTALSEQIKLDRKYKKLQKINKPFKSSVNISNFHTEQINSAIIASMPSGPARIQLEKMLKKQKHKQKKLKQHMLMEIKNKNEEKKECTGFPYNVNVANTKEDVLHPIKNTYNDIITNNLLLDTDIANKAINSEFCKDMLPQIQTISKTPLNISNLFGKTEVNHSNFVGDISNNSQRNKLNIFKKISKQKNLKPADSNKISNIEENQIINLPSGTTITPSSVISEKKFEDVNQNFLNTMTFNTYNAKSSDVYVESNICPITNKNCSASDLIASIPSEGAECFNKPKKRGRKPGSKNNICLVNTTTGKKEKKSKPTIPFDEFNILNQNSLIAEPLNLTNVNTYAQKDILCKSNVVKSLTIGNSFTNISPDISGRKERKKKSKFTANPAAGFDSNSSYNEVSAIPNTLKRLDVGVKTTSIDLTSTERMSNPYSVNEFSIDPKISANLNKHNVDFKSGIPLPTSAVPSTNILSMMPLYPFSPKPGLIPSAGIFPSGFGNFLPFPSIKAQPLNIKGDFNQSIMSQQQKDIRNICNVPRLVPESMSIFPTDIKTDSSTKEKFSDCPKTPKIRSSPSTNDIFSDQFTKNFDKSYTPECSSIRSTISTVPTTPGGISINTFESIIKTPSLTEFSPSKHTISSMSNTKPPIKQSKTENLHIKSTISNEDPIEVSDESCDMPQNQQLQQNNEITHFSQTLPSMDDIFVPNIISCKDGKKPKKPKKPFFLGTNASNINIDLYHSSNSSCVGKLAGGADLIPLNTLGTETGLSYSSKNIPSSSLTAAVTAVSQNKASSTLPNNIITSTTSISRSFEATNEHKKFKKIKDIKIKKKKNEKNKA